MSDWKKAAEEREREKKKHDGCIIIADQKGRSDEEKSVKYVECRAQIETMSPAEREAFFATHHLDTPAPPPSPVPAPDARYQAQRLKCQREAAKAPNEKVRANFMEWCLADVPPRAVPASVQAFATSGKASPETLPIDVDESELIDDVEISDFPFEGAEGRFETSHKGGANEGVEEEEEGEESGVRTYSTSLRIPAEIKALVARRLGSAKSPEYYQFIGVYERIFALGVQELCQKSVALLEEAPAVGGSVPATSHCHPAIEALYTDLYQTLQIFYTHAFRNRHDALGRPGLTDPAFRPLFKAFPDLERVCTKIAAWGTLTLAQTKAGWSYLQLTIPNLKDPTKEPLRLIAPPLSSSQLRRWAAFYGRGASKLEESIYQALHNSFRHMTTLVRKLFQFQQTLQSEAFSYAIGNYLLTGYLPFHVRRVLAKRWKVTQSWVRDLTFGWRRKLDVQLPKGYQMQTGSQQSKILRIAIEQVLSAPISKDDRLILAYLGRRSLLHRLLHPGPVEVALPPGIVQLQYYNKAKDLYVRLQGQLGAILSHLPDYTSGAPQEYGSLLTLAYPETLALAPAEVQQALEQVKRETMETLRAVKSELAACTDPAECDQLTFYIERKEAFIATCDLLGQPEVFKQLKHLDLFEVVRPISKQFHACATIIEHLNVRGNGRDISLKTKLKKQDKRSTIRGVLGAILARACLNQVYPGRSVMDVAQRIATQLTPSAIITPPFCSPNWARDMFPLELIMNPEFLLYREAPYKKSKHSIALTELLRACVLNLPPTERQRGRVGMMIALPKEQVLHAYTRFQQSPKGRRLLQNPQVVQLVADLMPQLMTEFKQHYPHLHPGLPMEAPLTPEMEECLTLVVEKDAPAEAEPGEKWLYPVSLVYARVNPPLLASYKVVVNLVFSVISKKYSLAAFAPAQGFYRARSRERGEKSPRGDPPRTPFDLKNYQPLIENRIIGVDINRIYSPWLLTCATSEQVLDVVPRLGQSLKLARKLRWYRYRDQGAATGLFEAIRVQLGTVIPPDLLARGDQAAAHPAPLEQLDQAEQVIREMFHTLRVDKAWGAVRQLEAIREQHKNGIYAEIQRVQRALSLNLNDLATLQNGRTPFEQLRYRVLHRQFRTTGHYQDPRKKGLSDERWARYTSPEALEQLLKQKVAAIQIQLTLLHRRKRQVKASMDREIELALARILIDAQAGTLAVEDLQLTRQGVSREMAKLITDIAKRPEVTDSAWARVRQYHWQGTGKPTTFAYERVDPRGTSQTCGELVKGLPCNQKLQNIPANPDLQECPVHGRILRHPNSARRVVQVAINLQQRRAAQPVP